MENWNQAKALFRHHLYYIVILNDKFSCGKSILNRAGSHFFAALIRFPNRGPSGNLTTNWQSSPHSYMRIYLLLSLLALLVLFTAPHSTLALTDDEIGALQALYDEFPVLQDIDPPWRSNVSRACTPPYFYGVTCSSGGDQHVMSLYGEEEIFVRQTVHFLGLYQLHQTS